MDSLNKQIYINNLRRTSELNDFLSLKRIAGLQKVIRFVLLQPINDVTQYTSLDPCLSYEMCNVDTLSHITVQINILVNRVVFPPK